MIDTMPWIKETPGGVTVSLLIQPRASKNEIVGPQAESLKVRLTAPPVAGAANKMCAAFLAKCLGVSKSSLEIVSGQSSRHKQILIRSAHSVDEIREKLEKAVK
jgi:uncharacterized protein (TIGR00251 family)